ncbi:hypothetical protein DPMN_012380 [Dreissena polymorpha]|uniref:Solute carrier family 43 member 3 n=1 Tax=Dreissena polymorpha TaxID=45954 RepID=A0A9D4S3B3_DREPO|nr:hypothetical protein DPMN_012380 [Dreissena polymorpha]
MLPLGIFLDIYGTSRTRIIAMCCTALGSLTMLFANEVIWLIFPALLMLGISGLLVLLTDLQVSNLFGSRRLTTMSTIVGASFSGGIVIILMKLTREADVSLHTSFMLISVGFVPILISTIVMLPRSRIPWPLPVGYGKNRGTELQGTQSVKGKGWKRRISDGAKKRCDMMAVLPIMKTRLYMCMVVWFSLMSLKSLVFDLNIEQNLLNLGVLDSDVTQYMSVYAICSLFCLPLSPCVGLIMDWNRTIAEPHHIGQMRSILFATWINYAISFMSSVFALFPNYHVQVISYILVAAEKSTFYATFLAFITHVHFPGEHFGKLVGVALAVSGFFLVAQHPLKLLVYHGFAQHTFYMPSIVLIMILVASCHPICVWCHCKTGKINGSVDTFEEDKTGTELMIESHRDTKTDATSSEQLLDLTIEGMTRISRLNIVYNLE